MCQPAGTRGPYNSGMERRLEAEKPTYEAAKAGHGIVYLAAPYSDPSPAVRRYRYQMATIAAAELATRGTVVFSPLTMTHPMDIVLTRGGGTLGSEFWLNFDKRFMECCSELYVLKLGGWNRSKGVAQEIEFFETRNLPIHYVDPEDLGGSLHPLAA